MSAPEARTPSPPAAADPSKGRPAAQACSSCGRTLIGWGVVMFICPKCGAPGLGRCAQCRDQSVPYRCPQCDFQGP